MGNFQSNTMNSLANEYTTAVTNIINTNVNNNTTACNSLNEMMIQLGITPSGNYCPLNIYGQTTIGQSSAQVCAISSSVVSNLNTTASNILSEAATQVATQNSQAYQQFLSTAFSDQSDRANFVTNLTTSIDTQITNESLTNCQAQSTNENLNEIYMCGNYYGPVDINQTLQMQVMANCLAQNLSGVTVNNESLQDILQSADQSLKSTQEGIFSFLDKFWKIILGVIIIIVIIGLIGIFVYFILGRSKSKTPTPTPMPSLIPPYGIPAPVSAPVSTPISAPVTAPISAPVTAPVTAPVSSSLYTSKYTTPLMYTSLPK